MTPAPHSQAPPAGELRFRWYQKLIGLLFVILCFEIGIFLVAFPWSDYWASNYFAWISPDWYHIWRSPFLRGAVSGLGVVNLYISLIEVFRLQRFSAGIRGAGEADASID